MRIAAVLSPVADWPAVLDGARAADEAGLDAIGLYDHYHSARPEWAYVCGWSAYGALAMATSRVRLVPMILNGLHYELGVLAKETSVLARISDDRFEMGIGAGDWQQSFIAWGTDFPPAQERIDRLEETVLALHQLWTGRPVSRLGVHIKLDGAISTPYPEKTPRVVVGVGGSRRVLDRAVSFADEINLYDDAALIGEARDRITAAGRSIAVSVFLSWEWEKWPADPEAELKRLATGGVDRAFVTVAAPDMIDRIERLGVLAARFA